MSPRRKFSPGEEPLLLARPVEEDRRPRGLMLASVVGAVVMSAAIAVCSLMLVSHESRVRAEARRTEALNYVTGFMTQFTSIDPYHANDYVSRILAQATGDFAKQYQDKANEILLQVARAEPATGSVLGAGLERWNDDGSATVMVATEVTTKSTDGREAFGKASRWTATAKQEGKQWKISNLLQVI
jgi:Mce-associated membrane protein